MTGRRRATAPSRLIIVSLVLAVLAIVLFYRPGGEEASTPPPDPTPSPPTTSAPPEVSEEAFCAEFRRLAAAQGEYAAVPDERATELLREAVDRLVATGVPATMTIPARAGYYTLLEGIYSSLGLSLEPSAVGAPDDPVEKADAAFTSYLTQYCPA